MALTVDVLDALCHEPHFLEWLREQGVEPNLTFKVEIAGTEIIVHQYAVNDNGAKYVADGEVALKSPFTVAVQEPLPTWLRHSWPRGE